MPWQRRIDTFGVYMCYVNKAVIITIIIISQDIMCQRNQTVCHNSRYFIIIPYFWSAQKINGHNEMKLYSRIITIIMSVDSLFVNCIVENETSYAGICMPI